MEIRKAERKQAKIKLGLQGPSGSGKTYSSLLLAKGLVGLTKTCIIDTENRSADLYSHLGDYSVIILDKPFTPEKYVEAIELAEKNFECIIIDSLSHAWEYLIEYHAGLSGNSFTNWSKVTPRHQNLIQKILSSPVHVISNLRVKQDYIIQEKNGKMVPEKVGLKSIQRDGIDYEFAILFELSIQNIAKSSKDRTGLFNTDLKITEQTGKLIKDWCLQGINEEQVVDKIRQTENISELTLLYKKYNETYPDLLNQFIERKSALTTKITENGSPKHQ